MVFQCPDYWDDEDRVRADLQLEATGNDKILTFLAKVKAQRALVEKLMNDQVTKEDEAGTQDALHEVGLLPDEADPMFKDVRFNERQERLERSICKLLDAAKAAREAPNEAAWEHIVDEAAANSRPQAVRPSRHGQDHGDRQVRAQMPSTGWPRPLCTTHRPAGLEG